MGNVQTRQFDAKGMAHRRGSISWNFRYPNTSRKRSDQATMMVYNPKLSVADWLQLLNLRQYECNLQMYNRVEDILELNDSDLKAKGIVKPMHRTKMLSSLVGVQAKRRQSMNIDVSSLPSAMMRRKNSCPPMYLAETCTDFNDTLYATVRRRGDRNSLPVRCGIDQRKRLSSCEESSLNDYEEIDSPDTGSPNLSDSPFDNCKTSTATPTTTATVMEMNSGSAPTQGSIAQTPHQSIMPDHVGTAMTTSSSEHQEAIALKKALEWELSLDAKDLRSHAWYHGPLPRHRAEEIVQNEGDFLIRDCTSQPDNYVLSCRIKTAVLHFVINKIILQPETVYERVQYQFEEDAFDTVPDLITFYVGSDKPISAASGARIQSPCNRTYPLSFYGHKIVGNQLHMQMLTGLRGPSPLNSPLGSNPGFRFTGSSQPSIIQSQQQQSQPQSPMSSPPRTKRDTPPRLPSKKQRSQSLTPAQAVAVSNMMIAESNGSDGDGVVYAQETDNFNHINCHGLKTVAMRRLSNFEKSHSLNLNDSNGELQIVNHLGNNKMHNGNGFQTIARCSISEIVDHVKFTTHSLPRPTSNGCRSMPSTRMSSLARSDLPSDTGSSWSTNLDKHIAEVPEKPPSPPPKPVRAPSLPRKEKDLSMEQQQQQQQQQVLQRAAAAAAAAAAAYHASGSDSGNGSGDSVQSSIPGDSGEFTLHRGVIIKNPRFMSNSASSATLKSLTDFDTAAIEEQLFSMEIPELKVTSKFDIENFTTLLLPSVDNKPLDGDALTTFKMMLLETGPKLIAEHMTRIDIGLLIEKPSRLQRDDYDADDLTLPVDFCGLELLTLPQGKVFRNDLIERTQCIKLLVAVTILTCQTDLDRAELLSKWIQIAVETKTALGNLFGFCAVMLGLCMPQIQKLDKAWHILRQKYTDNAFTFEAKLRPTLISMNECSNPQAPNTTVPHALLYALLKDRPVIDILSTINANTNANANATERSSLYTTCITSWESKADDFGLTINFLHFDSARGFIKSLDLYRKNAKIILEESNSRLDELLSDAFRTEFHIKFLWGSTGALASAEDRHTKLEKVLTLMADKFSSTDKNSIAA